MPHIVFCTDADCLLFLRQMTFQEDLFVSQPHAMRDTREFLQDIDNTMTDLQANTDWIDTTLARISHFVHKKAAGLQKPFFT